MTAIQRDQLTEDIIAEIIGNPEDIEGSIDRLLDKWGDAYDKNELREQMEQINAVILVWEEKKGAVNAAPTPMTLGGKIQKAWAKYVSENALEQIHGALWALWTSEYDAIFCYDKHHNRIVARGIRPGKAIADHLVPLYGLRAPDCSEELCISIDSSYKVFADEWDEFVAWMETAIQAAAIMDGIYAIAGGTDKKLITKIKEMLCIKYK